MNSSPAVWLRQQLYSSLPSRISLLITPLRSLQSPFFRPKSPSPPRGILFKSFPPVSTALPPILFLIRLMPAFSISESGWLRLDAPVAALLRGRAQQDTDKQKLSLYEGFRLTLVDVCLGVCGCVCVHPSPWGETSYLCIVWEKNRPICRCRDVLWVRTDTETFWFTRGEQTKGLPVLLCNQSSLFRSVRGESWGEGPYGREGQTRKENIDTKNVKMEP